MAIYYRLAGVIADFALVLNVVLLIGALAALNATLTLPGIAGIILTIGMSVDSNVLIFERIREELRQGKPVRLAVDAGYEKAFLTIIDAHVTTLITALVLFLFGTGPIKGFAVTLSLGVTINLFTALVGTKVVFDLMHARTKVTQLSI
jgi:preprotein translocase subunit SecD